MYPAAYPRPGNKDMNFCGIDELAADLKMIEFIVDNETFVRFDIRRLATVSCCESALFVSRWFRS